jgi:hypothetical protein
LGPSEIFVWSALKFFFAPPCKFFRSNFPHLKKSSITSPQSNFSLYKMSHNQIDSYSKNFSYINFYPKFPSLNPILPLLKFTQITRLIQKTTLWKKKSGNQSAHCKSTVDPAHTTVSVATWLRLSPLATADPPPPFAPQTK